MPNSEMQELNTIQKGWSYLMEGCKVYLNKNKNWDI